MMSDVVLGALIGGAIGCLYNVGSHFSWRYVEDRFAMLDKPVGRACAALLCVHFLWPIVVPTIWARDRIRLRVGRVTVPRARTVTR